MIINNDFLNVKLSQKVDLVVTSPPYAEQRKNQYLSISEKDYPNWTLSWFNAIKPNLSQNGSIFVNIRPHIKNGQISDYVLRTRLLLRDNGWIENEEIIWYKPDSAPLGSVDRPRRAWESILWFSLSEKPFCNPKANGSQSNRIGFESTKFEQGGKSHIHAGQNDAQNGFSRCTDVIIAGSSKIEKGFNHPAMFPIDVPHYLISMCSKERDTVLDPFMGSGTTLRAAQNLNRKYIGCDVSKDYCDMAKQSLFSLFSVSQNGCVA